MAAAGAVAAQIAATAPWKTAETAVSHSAHSPSSSTLRRGSVLVSEGGQKILSLDICSHTASVSEKYPFEDERMEGTAAGCR
jgi:hypothetical protein